MDYTSITLEEQLINDKLLYTNLLEQMVLESDLIISCLESYQVLLEEAEKIEKTQTKTVSILTKLKEFFKRLLGLFTKKTMELFNNDNEWMNKNLGKLDSIDFSNIKIEMIPFWNMDVNKMKTAVTKINDKINSVINDKNNLPKYNDIEAFKSDILKEYLDDSGDLVKGLKNYFSVGNAKGPLKYVSLEGDQLKKTSNLFKEYCQSYKSVVIPFINSLMNSIETNISSIEKTIKSRSVKESYCLVENSFFIDNDLQQFPSFIILEAEQPAENNKPDNNQTEKQDEVKRTKVTVVNKESDDKKDGEKTYKDYSSDQLMFVKNAMKVNQLILSSLMTILEEKYRAYLTALKGIIKNN